MTSQIVEEHLSPDGLLRLVVMQYEDGGVYIGFDGYPWHTHGDSEAAVNALTPTEAIRLLLERITNNELLLAVSRVGGVIRDIWPTGDPGRDLKDMPSDESIEFRWWDINRNG